MTVLSFISFHDYNVSLNFFFLEESVNTTLPVSAVLILSLTIFGFQMDRNLILKLANRLRPYTQQTQFTFNVKNAGQTANVC